MDDYYYQKHRSIILRTFSFFIQLQGEFDNKPPRVSMSRFVITL